MDAKQSPRDRATHAAKPPAHRDDRKAAEDPGDYVPDRPDPRNSGLFDAPPRHSARGLGPEAGGQAGDTEGLSRDEVGPESVEELIEEGQAYEAGVISGVEDAPNADQGPVRTRQVPEDDVPEEYLDDDRPG